MDIRWSLFEVLQKMKLFFFAGGAAMSGGAAPVEVEVELNR
jgi:hypothetical protein